MRIKRLGLTNFRNYELLNIDFHEKLNLVMGNNGQGKSNLLEGIYILSLGKSFRTSKDVEMIHFESDFLRAEGFFEKGWRSLNVEVILSRVEGSRNGVKKIFGIDGIKGAKNADLLEGAYIVVFSPEDLRMVKDEPEKRRRFMDRELFQIKPLYYKDLAKYKKSLQQRNSLLKKEDIDDGVLDAWDENLIYYGMRVMKERNRFIVKLKDVGKRIHGDITGGKETLELEYEPNVEVFEDEKEQRNVFEKKIKENRDKDIKRMNTSVGPHRDDIRICVNGVDVRCFGSQGQQRTAALSMKLAELEVIKEETGEDAVILMDDVLSELDFERQRFLVKAFEKNQIFISTAGMSDEIKGSFGEGRVFNVENGGIC